MLQPNRFLKQWRLGLWVKDVSTWTSCGLSVIPQNHPRFHQVLDSQTNCRNLRYSSMKILDSGHHSMLAQCPRHYSNNKKRNFIGQFIDNVRQEVAQNKEMKENLRKFREEAKKLEESDALQKARAKYMNVEKTFAFKDRLGKVKDTVSGVFEEASKSDIAKKAGKITEEIGKSARDAAGSISATGSKLGASETLKTISEATTAVKEEIENTSRSWVYVSPTKLRKRLEVDTTEQKDFKPDDTTTHVELHRDSRFYQSWENFKNTNPYFNKLLNLKLKYEESDNFMVRASRALTDRIANMFETNELSTALTEIVAVDPTFTKERFLRLCQTDIIPNILEAYIRGDLEILKDWCHEAVFKNLAESVKQYRALGGVFDSKILDLENIDLANGAIMDSGPVLIITFSAHHILCIRDKTMKVVAGDPDKVLKAFYVWALSRDRDVLNPSAAWRLLDIAYSESNPIV